MVCIKLQALTQKITFNCKGRLLVLDQPVVMGIINATPDSFFAGSRKSVIEDALLQAEKMLHEGATILDIGGQSTRPGALMIEADEEMQRVIPVIEAIAKNFPHAFLSVDTFRAKVANAAVDAGAHIVNDVSAGDDDDMMHETISKLKVPYIIMHKKGNPSNMQHKPIYDNVVLEVLDYLAQKVHTLHQMHIHDIIIDPGFGFGKTLAHNYQLLQALKDFQILGLPVLVGVSRKKMIQQIVGSDAEGALNGTTIVNTMALMHGAKVLRVHDVKEAMESIKLVNALHGNI